MSKIGENTKAKLEEKGNYTAFGVVRLEAGGFGVMKIAVSGTEVVKREVLARCPSFAEAMFEYQVASGKYAMDFMHQEILT